MIREYGVYKVLARGNVYSKMASKRPQDCKQALPTSLFDVCADDIAINRLQKIKKQGKTQILATKQKVHNPHSSKTYTGNIIRYGLNQV